MLWDIEVCCGIIDSLVSSALQIVRINDDVFFVVVESDVTKARKINVTFPEAAILKKHMSRIAYSIEGGLLPVANDLEHERVLTFEEKQACTDPTNKHDLFYTQKMLDEVGTSIKGNEQMLDKFLEIMELIGGPAATMVKSIQAGIINNDPVLFVVSGI